MAMVIVIVAPTGPTLNPGDTVVLQITDPSQSIATASAIISDPMGAHTAWTHIGGIADGFTGTVTTIPNGVQVSLNRNGGWIAGTSGMSVSATGTSGGMILLYDNTFPPIQSVETVHHPQTAPPGFYELTGIPFSTFGTGPLRIIINSDMQWTGGDDIQTAALTTPGTFIGSISYDSGMIAELGNESAPSGGYGNQTWIDDFNGTTNPWCDYTGDGLPKSIYFTAPHVPSSFTGGAFNIKNIHVTVYSEGGTPDAVTATISWIIADGGWSGQAGGSSLPPAGVSGLWSSQNPAHPDCWNGDC